MNGFALTLLVFGVLSIVSVARRWAALPLIVVACYMTNAQSISLGPFHFTVLRTLLLAGFFRVAIRGEKLPGGLRGSDILLLFWGLLLILSSFVHHPFGEALVNRLGNVYNVLGIYFLLRIFCHTSEALTDIIRFLAITLAPVSIEMVSELVTAHNWFSFLGGVPLEVLVRDGKLRAQGPFGHPILAGTVGALCVPLMIGIWRSDRRYAIVGIVACLGMVFASASSGPIMSLLLALMAIWFWRFRKFLPLVRFAAVAMYILCDIIMTRPAYFLLERIDLTGSSTGYHRAAIIEAGVTHLNEWWLGGTDYTRHWMPYGVSWSENHVDITNHYLFYGVDGGLFVMLLFIAVVWFCFRYVGQTLRIQERSPLTQRFQIWCLGSTLFAHAATMISVAYFDQSVLFLYLTLAVITSLRATSYPGGRMTRAVLAR